MELFAIEMAVRIQDLKQFLLALRASPIWEQFFRGEAIIGRSTPPSFRQISPVYEQP
jgi:hypothetical protein